MRDRNEISVDSRFLQTCELPMQEYRLEPFTMVIFGGSGDLSRKKLIPTLYQLHSGHELGSGNLQVLATGRSEMSDEAYRSLMKDEISKNPDIVFDNSLWDDFESCLFYLSCSDDSGYERLGKRLQKIALPSEEGMGSIIFYLAIPPDTVPAIVEQLKKHGLTSGRFKTRIVIEKPFGRDLASARKLNAVLQEAFDESQIYRIDHYLGKETVQNIIFLRFSNILFEQTWNSRYIDNVQITVAESIGIERRGSFYEETGVVRDIVQNHIMQLIGLIAMEPPIGFGADLIRDEKVKVFRSFMPMDKKNIDAFSVKGQYGSGKADGMEVLGYRKEQNVAPDSLTPTFMAAKLYIANWRWAGVPFYIRTGKRLARHITEICIQFKQPPLRLFGRTCDPLEPNVIVLTIQPDEKISIRFGVKYPGSTNQIAPVVMQFSYHDAFPSKSYLPYERLLLDCMKGDLTQFVRQDGVEAIWEMFDPLIARWDQMPTADFPNYAAGSWGPVEADQLLLQEGRRWLTI